MTPAAPTPPARHTAGGALAGASVQQPRGVAAAGRRGRGASVVAQRCPRRQGAAGWAQAASLAASEQRTSQPQVPECMAAVRRAAGTGAPLRRRQVRVWGAHAPPRSRGCGTVSPAEHG